MFLFINILKDCCKHSFLSHFEDPGMDGISEMEGISLIETGMDEIKVSVVDNNVSCCSLSISLLSIVFSLLSSFLSAYLCKKYLVASRVQIKVFGIPANQDKLT